jgi:nucleoside 2-deoxyribosyltransferase
VTPPDLKPVIFVLMPAAPEFDEVYSLGVQAACTEAGMDCARADQQIFEESHLARIYNLIGAADLVVSDLSGSDPTVFYETGFAHALGKVVILLARDAADIPFDRQHYPHVVYGDRIADLKGELTRHLRWFLDQRSEVRSLKSEALKPEA